MFTRIFRKFTKLFHGPLLFAKSLKIFCKKSIVIVLGRFQSIYRIIIFCESLLELYNDCKWLKIQTFAQLFWFLSCNSYYDNITFRNRPYLNMCSPNICDMCFSINVTCVRHFSQLDICSVAKISKKRLSQSLFSEADDFSFKPRDSERVNYPMERVK